MSFRRKVLGRRTFAWLRTAQFGASAELAMMSRNGPNPNQEIRCATLIFKKERWHLICHGLYSRIALGQKVWPGFTAPPMEWMFIAQERTYSSELITPVRRRRYTTQRESRRVCNSTASLRPTESTFTAIF